MVLVVVGEKRECLQKMLPRDEVAGCLCEFLRVAVDIAKVGGDLKVCGGLNASNSYLTGNPWTQEVHKLDGFPHGVVMRLLLRERTVSTSVRFEKVCGRECLTGLPQFGAARKNGPGWIG